MNMKIRTTARRSMATAFVLFASRTILLPITRAFTSPSSQLVVSRQSFCSATTTTAAMMQQSPSSGPRQALIEKRLNQAFNPTFLEVQNTSHGQRSDESHFKVVVVSESFEGTRSLVGRHRAIHKAISESNEDGSSSSLGFHSLEIGAAKTPEEWGENSVVAPSPKCQGGDGRGMKN